jgi:RNA polymerase sigma-70 factor (ECF subfamily)
MRNDASESLDEFPLAGSHAASSRASLIEDEVVAFFEEFRAPVVRYMLSFHIPVADAEELVQDVFLSLFEHLRRGKPRTNLQGWIFRVAHNAALKCRLQARRQSDRFIFEPGLSMTATDPAPGPEESLAARQRQARLLAVVRALPERDRCCLSLRAEGLRYREISEVLDMSLGSVAASIEKSVCRLMRAEQT